MKLFECQHCGQPLYFENVRCESCGRGLGYLPAYETISALEEGKRYAYKVVELREGMLGGKMSGDKLEDVLNDHAKDGWQLKAITSTEVICENSGSLSARVMATTAVSVPSPRSTMKSVRR